MFMFISLDEKYEDINKHHAKGFLIIALIDRTRADKRFPQEYLHLS